MFRWWWMVATLTACRLGFDSAHDTQRSDARSLADAMRTQPPGDAGVCDPVACAAGGGTCAAGACELVAASEALLQCPSGMPCRLVCDGYRYCRDGASCDGATWCEVACIGYRACQDGVACGAALCEVTCNGEEACEAGITLSGGTCTSHCCGLQTCSLSNPCETDEICQ